MTNLSFKEVDGAVRVIDCPNWLEFKRKAYEILSDPYKNDRVYSKFLFRGQSCSSWPLCSSFQRNHDDLGPAEQKRLYDNIINQFIESYISFGFISNEDRLPRLDPDAPLEQFEMLAQHYGISTKLLDFSLSMYVAAFFAVSKLEECTTSLISIWALRADFVEFTTEDHIKLEQDFYPENVRNIWQVGSFVRNKTSHENLADIFREGSKYCENTTDPLLIRFDIPKSEADFIKQDLEMMRINSMTIFPGIEGVVGWINSWANKT